MEHEEQADRMERVADDMEKQAGKLGDEIDDVREDWQTKQSLPWQSSRCTQLPSLPGLNSQRCPNALHGGS